MIATRHNSSVVEFPSELEILTTRKFDAPAELVYDVLTDPSNRSAGRAQRVTYLIDPEGTIREAYKVEDIEMHPAKVLADLRAILGIKV